MVQKIRYVLHIENFAAFLVIHELFKMLQQDVSATKDLPFVHVNV